MSNHTTPIVVLKPFSFAHRGHIVQDFEPGDEPQLTTAECAELAIAEGWAVAPADERQGDAPPAGKAQPEGDAQPPQAAATPSGTDAADAPAAPAPAVEASAQPAADQAEPPRKLGPVGPRGQRGNRGALLTKDATAPRTTGAAD